MAATMPAALVAQRCSSEAELVDDEVSGEGMTTNSLRVTKRNYLRYRLNRLGLLRAQPRPWWHSDTEHGDGLATLVR